MTDIEIWRTVIYDGELYESLYQVSNWGRVKSLGNGGTHKTSRILKPVKSKKGYLQVLLYKNGKRKMCKIHRLVAETFLENPENLPEVNHKDENKTNNLVGTPENNYKDGNLEWVSHRENINHGTRNERVAKALSKPVLQLSLSGELIREWTSIEECGRNGFNKGCVCNCCKGKLKTHKGFRFMYK